MKAPKASAELRLRFAPGARALVGPAAWTTRGDSQKICIKHRFSKTSKEVVPKNINNI